MAFFLSPFIVHRLGDSAYGIWVLLMSLTGYLGLLDLGVRGAVTRYVAKFHTLSNHEEVGRIASSALAIFAVMGALAISVTLLLGFLAVHFFRIPETYQSPARIVLFLAGINVAVSLMSGVFGGVVAGLRRFDLQNAVEIVSTSLRALAIVFALSVGKGLIALALIQLIFSLATGLAYAWISFWFYPHLQIRVRSCDRQHLRLILSFSASSFLLQAFVYLIFYTDSVVIGAFLPVGAVTFFAIAGNLINYARSLISGISTTMTPLSSALEAGGNQGELQTVLLKGTRYATMLILPIAVSFFIRGKSFIGLWMGPAYAELSGHVLWVLSLALIFTAANQVATATMLGINKHHGLVPIGLGEALSNLALSIAWVQSLGVVGVAWGTTLPNLAVSLFFWPWYLRRTLEIPIRGYFVSTWIRPGIAVVPFTIGTYAIEKFWTADNLFVLFVQVGAVMPLTLMGFWYIGLGPSERQQLSRLLGRPWSRAWSVVTGVIARHFGQGV